MNRYNTAHGTNAYLKSLLSMSIVFSVVSAFATTAVAGVIRDSIVAPPYEITKTASGQDFITWTSSDAPERGTIAEPGCPDLPTVSVRLATPPNANAKGMKLTVREIMWQDVPGDYAIPPVPMRFALTENGAVSSVPEGRRIERGMDVDVYATDGWFPSDPVVMRPLSQARKWKFVTVDFCPFRCNAVTRRLQTAACVKFEILYGTHRATSRDRALLYDKAFDRVLPAMLKNRKTAAKWYRASAGGAASQPLLMPYLVSTPSDYVIITTSAIQAASSQLSAFVAAKQSLGYSPLVVTEADWGGGTGNTAAEHIRSWLKANYATLGIKYVLLIGNPNPSTGDVPMKMCYPRKGASDGYSSSPTDYYYADLTGNWDLNGDGYYGDFSRDSGIGGIDLAPEVYVGRIPYYGVPADLDTILLKIADYETASGDLSWRKSGLVAGAVGYYANESGAFSSVDGGSWGEYIKKDVFAASSGNYTSMYEKSGVAPMPEPCDFPLVKANIVSQWNVGFGFVLWFGHGSSTSAARKVWSSDANADGTAESSELSYPVFLGSSEAATLPTSAAPIVIGCSCETGHPEVTNNLQYSLLRRSAVAAIGASRVSWGTWGDWCPGRYDLMAYGYYIPKMMLLDKVSLAQANYWVRQTAGDAYDFMNACDFNIYGDPSMKISEVADPLAITTSGLSGGTIGARYSQALVATGGAAPYSWSVVAGSLPAGLTLEASTGTISGTPTLGGTQGFTVQVADGRASTATRGLSLTITSDLAISTTAFPDGKETFAYSAALSAVGGVGSYSWSVISGALPAGLTLDAATGAIAGTPTTSGTNSFVIGVADSQIPANSVSKAFSIAIHPAIEPVSIVTTGLAAGKPGAYYYQTMAASGGVAPYAWSIVAGTMPTGLSMDPSTGVISGTPRAGGTVSFTVRAADYGAPQGSAQKALSITIRGKK